MLLAPAVCGAEDNASARQARQRRQRHEKAIVDEFVALLAIPNMSRDRANIESAFEGEEEAGSTHLATILENPWDGIEPMAAVLTM